MEKSISLVIGAGFSAPMGYPVGNTLNEKLLKCKGDDFSFSQSGVLVTSTTGKKPYYGYNTSYDIQFEFCKDLMQYFNNTRGYFDYEEFYDFFNFDAADDSEVQKLFKEKYNKNTELNQMLFGLKNIFSQLVAHFLFDKNKNSWYDNQTFRSRGTIHGYTGILEYLEKIGKEYIVNIHTLNHDLYFESLNNSEYINNKLCDGFEELGSPYYGKLKVDDRNYLCRLQYYTEKYDKPFRLYKLHGSLDYQVFYSSDTFTLSKERYIKTRWKVDIRNLNKEVKNKDGSLEYERCWINYHADFLTGKTSKIERYKEPLLYEILFEKFKENLKNAEKLIIIGYGGKDQEINNIILEHFDFKKKNVYIIDPFAGKSLKELKKKLNGKLIEKQMEYITKEDLN